MTGPPSMLPDAASAPASASSGQTGSGTARQPSATQSATAGNPQAASMAVQSGVMAWGRRGGA
jgi:hypothetical protein